jgi:hypothetical protein
MTSSLFDRLQRSGSMLQAEQELLDLAEGAIPILIALFSGEARNQFGVPYRQLGLPLRCAMEVASRLGQIAKPLEPYLRDELRKGDHVAAMALGSLGTLEQSTVEDLAESLDRGLDLSYESAIALIRCNEVENSAVRNMVAGSAKAAVVLTKVRSHSRQKNIKQ